jgi:hypothetical protein
MTGQAPRSFSASTSGAASQNTIRVKDFIRWLRATPDNSPELRKLSQDEIYETFVTAESCRFLSGCRPSEFASPISSRDIFESDFDTLARCQVAQMSEDGGFLGVPNHPWMIKSDYQDTIFIRQAYKDHWDIIYHHFVVEKSRQRVIISGTPGCGKSIEGFYFVHKIFQQFCDNPPPIIYASSETSKGALVHFSGQFFAVGDYHLFECSLSYKIMAANRPVWHIYDSTVPTNHAGSQQFGPQIIISSPGRAERVDMKSVLKGRRLLLYLPLPTIDEMKLMRAAYHNDTNNGETYLSLSRMLALIAKWGCVPRTIFEIGNDDVQLDQKLSKVSSAHDVERLINMVGSSQLDHEVASGSFLHIVPIGEAIDYENSSGRDSTSVSETRIGKRKAGDTDVDDIGLSRAERIIALKCRYTKIAFTWASDYIRDQAFDAFLTLGGDRMMPLIVNYQQAILGGFRGLLLEPFVHKLLSGTGVVGRMKNLDTGKSMGSVRLGPWKTKNLYQNHTQLQNGKGIYNVPLKGNEAAVDSLVPYDGYCFQITIGEKHGINRPALDTLIATSIFQDFLKRKPRRNILFVFVVEAGVFDRFQQQNYHGSNKQAYAPNSPLRHSYSGVTQLALEIDLRRIYKCDEHQRNSEAINMTDRKAGAKLKKAAQKLRLA